MVAPTSYLSILRALLRRPREPERPPVFVKYPDILKRDTRRRFIEAMSFAGNVPGAGTPGNVKEIIGRARFFPTRPLAGRRDADDRNVVFPVMRIQPINRIQMRMTMQHEFRTANTEGGRETADTDHTLVGGGGAADRRMMDHHHAEQPLLPRLLQQFRRSARLPVAEIAGGRERWRGNRGGTADKRDGAAHAHIGENLAVVVPRGGVAIAADIGVPGLHGLVMRTGYIGVMIAGNDGGFLWIAHFLQPVRGGADFDAGRKIDEIAGDSQMIRRFSLEIVEQLFQRIGEEMLAAVAMPVDETGNPFRCKFPESEFRQRPQMDV
ncbi:hypothetical protein AT6N2_C3383 [Agrobacterium tumefaciens]|nr:hypothetical protein AT6N2_C3383 [Agrobacterium tumefaciens]